MAVRSKLKAIREAFKENGKYFSCPLECYFLIYWPEEDEEGTVSIHSVEELYTGKITVFG